MTVHEGNIEEENNGYKGRSRIHEHTISLRFLGKILRVLRLEISVYNVYIANQFQTTFARRAVGGVKKYLFLEEKQEENY
jgi:hypothetical protein